MSVLNTVIIPDIYGAVPLLTASGVPALTTTGAVTRLLWISD